MEKSGFLGFLENLGGLAIRLFSSPAQHHGTAWTARLSQTLPLQSISTCVPGLYITHRRVLALF